MVKLGDVQTFREVRPDKAQVLKVVEEAAEVYSAWDAVRDLLSTQLPASECWYSQKVMGNILAECADVIQATCNLISALNIEDFTPYMDECRKRNEVRGRM